MGLGMDALYDLVQTILRFMESSPGLPVSLLYLAVAAVPVTLLHEIGHALAARHLLGGEVKVSVGTAGKLAELRLGQLTVFANALAHPGPGRRCSGIRELQRYRA
jgi:hypothetical protein